VVHWSVVTPSLYIWQHPSSGPQFTAWSLVHLPDLLAIFSGWPLTDHTIHIYLLHLFFVGCSFSALTLESADTMFLKNVGKQWPSDAVAHPRRLVSSFILLFSITNSDTLKHYSCVWKTECVQNLLDEIMRRWRALCFICIRTQFLRPFQSDANQVDALSSTQCCMFWSATDMVLDILCFHTNYSLYRMW